MIGIRSEDKSKWERRVPITPSTVRKLVADGIDVRIQPSKRRVVPDDEYRDAGATVTDDLSPCSIVFGVKEMPGAFFEKGRAYVFFSHTIKGQPYNMDMLRSLRAAGAHLIDYERIVDDKGRRLVLFGRFAGLAGMVDALHFYGKRLAHEGIDTPLLAMKPCHEYDDLDAAKSAVTGVRDAIRAGGWPQEAGPLVTGFAGYGNVSRGAQEIFDLLDPQEIMPSALATATFMSSIVKVVFAESDMVSPIDAAHPFALQDYYDHPEKYRSRFADYVPHIDLLVNAIYWEERYPRLITKAELSKKWDKTKRPRFVADISCDVHGAVEFLEKTTDPGTPTFVYETATGRVIDGVTGDGPVMLAVDILPCELPRESSRAFSELLEPFLRAMDKADFSKSPDEIGLPDPIRAALIVKDGRFTPDYRFMRPFLEGDDS